MADTEMAAGETPEWGGAKPEWGTKRTSPKTGRRFYDMGRDNPVTCPDTGYQWVPEPILKSKQTLPFEAAKTTEEGVPDAEAVAAELEIDPDADDADPVGDDADELETGEEPDVAGEAGDEER